MDDQILSQNDCVEMNDCVEVNGVDDTKLIKGKRKREKKHTSPVWTVFELLPEKTSDGAEQAKCKWCGEIKKYNSKNGTGNLNRHLNTCVRRDTRDVGQMLLGKDKNSLMLKSTKINPEVFREKLVGAIVMHNLPLSFVEYSGIKGLFEYLWEDINLISRNTVRSDIMKMHKREKNKLKLLLVEAPGRICLTSDLWTSVNTDGYISLTAHFVDKDWNLQKRLLSFSYMPPPHNGISLSEKVYSLLADWEIDNKLFSITLDDASSNNTFVDFLRVQLNVRKVLIQDGEFFHIRCGAHILNLIVQDGLKEIDDCVKKVRESVKYVKGSQVRKQKFLECVNLVCLDPKRGLRQDIPTRWNSTYLMLHSALYFRLAFTHLEVSDSNYKACPTKEEWDKIDIISQFLGVFYDITCMFSGSNYPTSNLYLPSIFMARLTLERVKVGADVKLKNMVDSMFEKYEKYWSEFSMILAIAAILDPRYKLHFVNWSYAKIYGNNSSQFAKVESTLHSLYNLYCNKSLTVVDGSTSGIEKRSDDGYSSMDGSIHANEAWEEFDIFQKQNDVSSRKSQVDLYLEEPRMDRKANLNILEYWKGNQSRYPELSSMARDILTIPVSTVASESAFSVGGKVIDQYRSSLKPDLVEALICTKDWLFGEAKDKSEDMVDEFVELDISNE